MKIKKKSKSGRNVVDCKMRLKKKGNMGKKLKNEKTPAGSEGESGSEMMLERSNISATQEWIVEDDDTSESRVLESENGTGGENDDFKDNEHSFLNIELDETDDDELSMNDDPVQDLSDEERNDGKSSFELLEAVRAIIPTKVNPMKRKEASKNVEEFVAVKRRVNVGEGGINKFLESVRETGDTKTADKVSKLQAQTENEKSLRKKRIKTLNAPEEKITSEKVKRTLLYDNAKEEVSRWNSIVYHNRSAEQLVFPLSEDNKAFKKPQKNNKEGTDFMPVTPLEEEIAKVLYGEDYVERKKAEMSKDPSKTDMESYLLSVEEAMATHSEMAKLRALQSYAMAKAKRQNKIKSKKYHRLLRKSKIKKQMKDFEELQKTDPQAAMIKLEELERARIQERMSLKHRNTSKWAKMQAARAKYDKDSRMALSEQLKISRDLTQKVQESSDEDEEDMELPLLVKSSVENPWMLKPSLQENQKLQMYYTGYKKFWEEYNRQFKNNEPTKEKESEKDGDSETCDSSNEEDEEEILEKNDKSKVGFGKKSNRYTDGDADELREFLVNDNEVNEENTHTEGESYTSQSSYKRVSNEVASLHDRDSKKDNVKVDPNSFLKITRNSSSIEPQFNAQNSKVVDLLEESDDSDDENDQKNLIAEAFEDDDIVNEFQKKKKEIVEESQPQEIDNFLPGWGSWTGKNIVSNERKKRKFIKKQKRGAPRKDARVSHVIINENVNEKARAHQVKEVPFPFTRVKDFEKTVRAPIGRTWMPESAVKSLTAPKVVTRLGQIIKPISEDVLAKPKEQKFNVPNTIIRMAKVTSKK